MSESNRISTKEINGCITSSVNITGLQKFVLYNVQVSGFTYAGDGVLSVPAVSVRTLEDGQLT